MTNFEETLAKYEEELNASEILKTVENVEANRLFHRSMRYFTVLFLVAWVLGLGVIYISTIQDNQFAQDCVAKGYDYGAAGSCTPTP